MRNRSTERKYREMLKCFNFLNLLLLYCTNERDRICRLHYFILYKKSCRPKSISVICYCWLRMKKLFSVGLEA